MRRRPSLRPSLGLCRQTRSAGASATSACYANPLPAAIRPSPPRGGRSKSTKIYASALIALVRSFRACAKGVELLSASGLMTTSIQVAPERCPKEQAQEPLRDRRMAGRPQQRPICSGHADTRGLRPEAVRSRARSTAGPRAWVDHATAHEAAHRRTGLVPCFPRGTSPKIRGWNQGPRLDHPCGGSGAGTARKARSSSRACFRVGTGRPGTLSRCRSRWSW